MIKRTRVFYEKNKKWIDKFLPKIIELEFEAYQKLEWNCQGDNFNLRKKIVSFRGSGVRVKRNNNSPTLISASVSQVPYLPWKKRYLSHEECLNIQGFKGIKSYPRSHEDFYTAIGNAVNVEVVSKIAKNLLIQGKCKKEVNLLSLKFSIFFFLDKSTLYDISVIASSEFVKEVTFFNS